MGMRPALELVCVCMCIGYDGDAEEEEDRIMYSTTISHPLLTPPQTCVPSLHTLYISPRLSEEILT